MVGRIEGPGKNFRYFNPKCIKELKNISVYSPKQDFIDAAKRMNINRVHVDTIARDMLNEERNNIAKRIIDGSATGASTKKTLIGALRDTGLEAAMSRRNKEGIDLCIVGEQANKDYFIEVNMGLINFDNIKKQSPLQPHLPLEYNISENNTKIQIILGGRPLSKGVAIGKAYLYYGPLHGIEIKEEKVPKNMILAEVDRFNKACDQVYPIYKNNCEKIKEEDGIGHLYGITMDHYNLFAYFEPLIEDVIRSEGLNAEFSTQKVISSFIKTELCIEDVRQNDAAQLETDYEGIMGDIISHLAKNKPGRLGNLSEENVILVADKIVPQDTLSITETDKVKGIITQIGGGVSHAAFISQARKMPAVQCDDIMQKINPGDVVIIDGEKGQIIINPDPHSLEDAKNRMEELRIMSKSTVEQMKGQDSILLSGERIALLANINGPEDLNQNKDIQAQGVGLYRTEFKLSKLLEGKTSLAQLPEEELLLIEGKLFDEYTKVTNIMKGGPVIIRTFDWGRDKQYGQYGLSGVRIYNDVLPIFMTQLMAILRASEHSNDEFGVIFPFIAGVADIQFCKEKLEMAKRQLLIRELAVRNIPFNGEPIESLISTVNEKKIHLPYNPKMKIGMMIELPSAAIEIDNLIKEADIFSYGTNDLTCYTRGIDDREDQKVLSAYYRLTVPSVFKLIGYGVKKIKGHGKTVEICGAMGGSLISIPPLIGMGLETFSMPPSLIPEVKKFIRTVDKADCVKLAKKVISATTAENAKNEILKIYPTLGKSE